MAKHPLLLTLDSNEIASTVLQNDNVINECLTSMYFKDRSKTKHITPHLSNEE